MAESLNMIRTYRWLSFDELVHKFGFSNAEIIMGDKETQRRTMMKGGKTFWYYCVLMNETTTMSEGNMTVEIVHMDTQG